MTRTLIFGLLLLFTINNYSYSLGVGSGKKVYTDLDEALKENKKVRQLKLNNQSIEFEKHRKIGELRNLQFLDIESCHLTDLPDEFFKLPDLKTLILNYNNITTIPLRIRYCKRLEYLSTYSCKLTTIPKEIESLNVLNLMNNNLTKIPLQIFKLSNLAILNFGGNPISEMRYEIENLKKHKWWNFQKTNITKERVRKIRTKPPPNCKLSSTKEDSYDINCDNVFCYVQEPPFHRSEYLGFKKIISTNFDTLQFCGPDSGSFVIKFIITRNGEVDSVSVIETNVAQSNRIKAILPTLGKWFPGRQEGKVCCVYVALKFEFGNGKWSIKRLDPCTLIEDKELNFKQ
jgi:hypothetical protein